MTSWGRPKEVNLQASFRDVLRMSAGRFSKTLRISNGQPLSISHNTFGEYDLKQYNSNVLCIMFKTGILGTSQGHRYVDVTLGRNKDVLWTSLRKLQDIG